VGAFYFQPESGQDDGPLLGGARPDPQSLRHARRPILLGRRIFPLSFGQHRAADLSISRTADVDAGRNPGVRILCGHHTNATFASYREEYARVHGRPASDARLADLGMAVTADSDSEARLRGKKLYSYYATVPRSPPGTFNPAGYSPIEANARADFAGGVKPYNSVMPDGSALPNDPSLEVLAEAGILFWGKPDQVVRQITKFVEQVGGLGHFLCLAQGGHLTHKETVDSLTLLSREVYPQLKELQPRDRAA
jgi:hypothetical protein